MSRCAYDTDLLTVVHRFPFASRVCDCGAQVVERSALDNPFAREALGSPREAKAKAHGHRRDSMHWSVGARFGRLTKYGG